MIISKSNSAIQTGCTGISKDSRILGCYSPAKPTVFLFIKIKPSIVYWGFALFFIANQLIKKENIIKKLLQDQIVLDEKKWKILSNSWIIFFIACGVLNLYVANFFPEEKWVEFKFYILGIILPVSFILLNGVYVGIYAKK